MSTRTVEDEGSLQENSSDRVARYADDSDSPRSVRSDVLEPRMRYQGFQPRRDRQLQWGPVLVAVVAGFLIAIMFGPRRSTDPVGEEELASLQSELQSARERTGQLESELSAAVKVSARPTHPSAAQRPTLLNPTRWPTRTNPARRPPLPNATRPNPNRRPHRRRSGRVVRR